MGNCLFLKKEKYNENTNDQNINDLKMNDLKVDFIDNLNLHNKVILEKCDQNNMIELTNQNIKEIIEKTSQKIDYNIIKEEENLKNVENINMIYEEKEVEEEYIDISDIKEYIENDIKSQNQINTDFLSCPERDFHISIEDDNESQNSICVERSESKSNDSTLKMESIE